ncbi:MAG: aminotransferase class I/II-fold pyridoxal phosphate-dependent enzyme [Desulfobacterales bacterium]|nr:aminotransferase class I/II-fold pyridoxal phosphate-dependent enzyme [Desulfobacterales bacterium]
MTATQRDTTPDDLTRRYRELQSRRINLDMTRGKPCPEQLDLFSALLEGVDRRAYRAADGTDCRNYGGLDGIPEAKALFAQYMGVTPEELIIGGSSSLTLMHDAVTWAMVFGAAAGSPPWGRQGPVKFLCPSPGYDRHFFVCEHLGIEMIPVAMATDGPDMDAVERLAAADAGIKGIWCVPKYSNPTGAVYSEEVVLRLAAMPTRAADFRIFWDNAYAVHHLGGGPAPLADILEACRRSAHPDRVLMFGSTSKISFAGSGIAFMAASRANMAWARTHLGFQTIGPDKLNQLRHVAAFKTMGGILAQMQKHAAILAPKFDAVFDVLEREIGARGVAQWTHPTGGYFISLDTLPGRARRVVQLAAEAGVKLTPAGSTFPLQSDPADANIRIAPSFPSVADIRTAVEVLCVCIRLADQEHRGRT